MTKILLYIISILISSFNIIFAECELQFNKNFFNSDIIGYYLSAIDIDSGESNVLLFDYELELVDQDINCSFPDEIDIAFSISIDIPNYTDGVIDITSGLFTLDFSNSVENLNTVSFKNTDLSLDTQYLPGGVRLLMNSGDYDINISSDEIDDLSSLILGLGRIPNGKYYFNFEVVSCTDFDCNNLFLNETIEVFLPSYLNLVSPGSSILSDSLSTEVFIPNPIFQWNADYCSNCSSYSIRICEYNPLLHNSLDEAINSVSILPLNQGFYDIGSLSNTFQYPVNVSESLVPGSFYVWQVKRSYETTYGTYDHLSDVFIFRMKSFDNMQVPSTLLDQDKINFILSILGESKFNELFSNEDSPFYNYTNANSSVKINNEINTFDFLKELFENSNIEIIEVDFE